MQILNGGIIDEAINAIKGLMYGKVVPFRHVPEKNVDKNKKFDYQGIASMASQSVLNTGTSTSSNWKKGKSLGTFVVTAYCTCTICTDGLGITASGTVPVEGRTIAVDESVIPLGTHVIINDHEYIAEDTGGAIVGNKIDMFIDDHDRATQWGVQEFEVFLADDSGTSTENGTSESENTGTGTETGNTTGSGTSTGNTTGNTSNNDNKTTKPENENRFPKISSLLDMILGLLFTMIKAVFVGFGTIVQILTTYYIDAASGENVESRLSDGMMAYLSSGMREDLKNSITLEKIVYNQVPLFDVDVFNGNKAAGKTLDSSSFVMIIRNVVSGLYMGIRNIALIGLLIVLIYLGIRLATATIGEQKAEYRKKLMNWFVAFFIIFGMHYFLIIVMKINEITVNMCSSIGARLASQASSGLYSDLALAMRDLTYQFEFTKSAVATVLYFVMIYYLIKFIIIYFKRLFITSILIILGPVLGIKYAVDKIRFNRSTSMSVWMKEYIFSVGTQTIHALVYTIFVGITYTMMKSPTETGRMALCILAAMFFSFMTTAEKITRKMLKLVGNQSDSIMGDLNSTDIRDIFGYALILKLAKYKPMVSMPNIVKRKYKTGKQFFGEYVRSEYVNIRKREYVRRYKDSYILDERGRSLRLAGDLDEKIDDILRDEYEHKLGKTILGLKSSGKVAAATLGIAVGATMATIGPFAYGTAKVYVGTKTLFNLIGKPILGYKKTSTIAKYRAKDNTYKKIQTWADNNWTQKVAHDFKNQYLNSRDKTTAKNELRLATLHQARTVELGLQQDIADQKDTLLKGAKPGATKLEKELSEKYTEGLKKSVRDAMKTVDREDIKHEVKSYMKENKKSSLTLKEFADISEKFDVKISGKEINEKVEKNEFIENVKAETMAKFIREVTINDGIAKEIMLDEKSMDIVENNLEQKLQKTSKTNEVQIKGLQNAIDCIRDKKNEIHGEDKVQVYSNLNKEEQKQVNIEIANAMTDQVIENQVQKLNTDQIIDTMKKAVNMEGSIKREKPIKEFRPIIHKVERIREIDEISRQNGDGPIHEDVGNLVEEMINNIKVVNQKEESTK